MKVFLSWSGPTSQQVASALRDWLPSVIQAIEPWMSEKDIKSGTWWSEEIVRELKENPFGVVCLTPDNKSAPWLHFEAGALANAVTRPRVCPYLFQLQPTDIVPPLGLLQGNKADKSGTLKMVESMNESIQSSNRLNKEMLARAFEKWWPELDVKLKAVPIPKEGTVSQRNQEDKIDEILQLVRQIVSADEPTLLDADKRSTLDILLGNPESPQTSNLGRFLAGLVDGTSAGMNKPDNAGIF